jgi:type VI secretion system protein ImpH
MSACVGAPWLAIERFYNVRTSPDSSLSVAARVDLVLNEWLNEPWRLDYFALLRRIEGATPDLPRIGFALLPKDEAVRIGQEPSLTFAPASFSRFDKTNVHGPVNLRQRFFGYLGPNAPLPTHLTEFVQLRYLNHGDATWLGFLDSLSHRFAEHFYRAWAQARPAVNHDRPDSSPFQKQVGSLVGLGTTDKLGRDEVFDDAKLFFSGLLNSPVRTKERIETVLQSYFGVPVKVQEWVGCWLTIPPQERSRLASFGSANALSNTLGQSAILGTQVWDRQSNLRLHIGPLSEPQFRKFLPNGHSVVALRDWMLLLLGREYAWQARLVLKAQEVPKTTLGTAQLGWDSWLGSQPRRRNGTEVEISQGDSSS